jgi:hypothetical protein
MDKRDTCCLKYGESILSIWRTRIHKKIESAHVGIEMPSVQSELEYWKGFNAGLEWAHRIVDGDKSAD